MDQQPPDPGAGTAVPLAAGERDNHVRVRLLRYNPAFDGLRAVAVLAVLVYHFSPFGWMPGGWIGVDVFFALSGFLITSLLLSERAERGRVSLGRFHVRRLLRLQPALWLFVGVWLAGLWAFGRFYWFRTMPNFPVTHTGPEAWSINAWGVAGALFEFNNWLSVGHVHLPPIGHLWSLAIEEQFYLVWPVLLLGVLRFRPQWALRVTAGLIALSAVDAVAVWRGGAGSNHVYFGTDTRAQALLLGALAAQLWTRGRLQWLAGRRGLRWGAGLAASAVLARVALFNHQGDSLRGHGGLTLVDAAAAVVVILLATGGSRVLSSPALVWVGRRSYAIYLWNYIFATWFHPLGTWSILAGLPATLLAAEASWRLVERRALALKDRLGRPAPAPAGGSGGRPRLPAAAPAG